MTPQRRLFGSSWTASTRRRATWTPTGGSAAAMAFGGFAAPSLLKHKACALRDVPLDERLYAASPSSAGIIAAPDATASSTPPSTATSVAASNAVTNASSDDTSAPDAPLATTEGATVGGEDDVCVAVHAVGEGSVGYFGDINCEVRARLSFEQAGLPPRASRARPFARAATTFPPPPTRRHMHVRTAVSPAHRTASVTSRSRSRSRSSFRGRAPSHHCRARR